MKNKITKGDLLEDIYYVFEKSLSTASEKTIAKKYKLKDRDGILREIDIYIEYKVDIIKTYKCAVECKNHNHNISIKEISDFYLKIEGLGIEGIFITTSEFQKGAIKKAKALNIKLYKFNKINNNNSIKDVLLFRKVFEIKNIRLISNNPSFSNDMLQEIFGTCPTCQRTLLAFMNKELYPMLGSGLEEMATKFYPDWNELGSIHKYIGKGNARKLGYFANLDRDSFKHKGEELKVRKVIGEILVWEELVIKKNEEPYTYQLLNYHTKNIVGAVSPVIFTFQGNDIFGALTQISDFTERASGQAGFTQQNTIQEIELNQGSAISIDDMGLKKIIEDLEKAEK